MQLAESEQQYAEIYEEYEKAREFYAGVEAAMHKAQQQYVRDKREWQVRRLPWAAAPWLHSVCVGALGP